MVEKNTDEEKWKMGRETRRREREIEKRRK